MPKLEPEPEAQKGKKINPFYQLGRKLMNDNKKFFAAFFFHLVVGGGGFLSG